MKKIILLALPLIAIAIWLISMPRNPTDALAVGQVIPELRFKDIHGNDYFFNDFKGKVVVIANWATWCQYCLVELPYLEQLRKAYPSEAVEIVTILHDPENLDLAKEIIANDQLTLPTLLNKDQPIISAAVSAGLPYSLLLDRKGTIRFVHRGFAPADIKKYEDEVKYLLGEK